MSERHPSTLESAETLFSRLYPEGSYREISLQEIPDSLREMIEHQAFTHSLDPEAKRPHVRYFNVKLKGANIYGARFDNEYTEFSHEDGDKDIYKIRLMEPSFYFFQLNDEGKNIGRGGVRYFYDSIRTKKHFPIVDYVETHPDHRKEGLGAERYRLMSALSRLFFEKNLHSSFAISPEAESVWNKLLDAGEAEIADEYTDEDGKLHRRYRLRTPV